MRHDHDQDHRANIAILAIAFVGVLAANTGGLASGVLMTACVVALIVYVLPRRIRDRSMARRHEPGIQILRYLAGTGGPVSRLQNDVVDSYVRTFTTDRSVSTRPRRTPRLSDVDRYLDRISRTYDDEDADGLIQHVEMMRRTRREYAPLAEEAFERVLTSLSNRDARSANWSDRPAGLLDGILAAVPMLRGEPTRPSLPHPSSPSPSAPSDADDVVDHSPEVMRALTECEAPAALDAMKTLRPLMRAELLSSLDEDLRREAIAACRDLSELADDFLRSRSRTGTPALDDDFVRVAVGVAARLEELRQRQAAREVDGFSERARFIEQRHGLPTGTPLDGR